MLTPTVTAESIAYLRANLTFSMSKGGYADKDRGYGFSGFITWGAGGTFIWDRYALFFQKSCRGYGP